MGFVLKLPICTQAVRLRGWCTPIRHYIALHTPTVNTPTTRRVYWGYCTHVHAVRRAHCEHAIDTGHEYVGRPQVAGACRQVGGTLTPNWHSAPHSSSIAMHSGELWGAVFPEIVRAQGRQEAKGGRSSLLVCRRESSIQHWAVSCRREGCDDAMLGSLCSTFDYTTRRAGVHAMVQAFAPVLRLTGMQRSREQDGAHPRAAGRHTSSSR